MSGRLKWYVAAVCTAGLLVLAALVLDIDLDRVRQVPAAIAVFTAFVVLGELVAIPIRHDDRPKDVAVSTTFAYGLVPLAGPGVAALAFMLASVVADVAHRKAVIKTAFNAAQYVLALAAGGAIYAALGGGYQVHTATLPALAVGGLAFMLVNYLLVSIVTSLAQGIPVLHGFRRDDIRLELGTTAMVLAMAPVAVVVADRSLALLPALLVPLGAIYLASKGELLAREQQAEAERDADRQRRLAEQEQEVVRRLQEADRMKADLLATVSHELRSPLTTILGVFGILRVRRRRLSPSERDHLVDMGIGQSRRLQRMIEQLLLAARFEQAERGAAPLQAARVGLDATALLDQAGAEARARHAGRAIAVETNGALPVRVAHDVVAQVLGNLIDNACKYSPDGEPVRLSANREGDRAVLAVEDQGPGIAPTDRERIFERFTQLDRQDGRRGGGIGLGLYIARQLARSQDGDLLVAEPLGPSGGARFELHLPLAPDGR
ncbi:MAG TPA: ATP-binding protein [Actinomycetota bacterium]|jgi:signal transduction histidine kinase|nr:ATP-binding protein [Actinomycetota bacterium]